MVLGLVVAMYCFHIQMLLCQLSIALGQSRSENNLGLSALLKGPMMAAGIWTHIFFRLLACYATLQYWVDYTVQSDTTIKNSAD